jgi:hypothetical protein
MSMNFAALAEPWRYGRAGLRHKARYVLVAAGLGGAEVIPLPSHVDRVAWRCAGHGGSCGGLAFMPPQAGLICLCVSR